MIKIIINHFKPMANPHNNKISLLMGGFLIVLSGLDVFFLPCPSSSQYIYFKVILAAAVAILSFLIIGTMNIHGNIWGVRIKAAGGFAIFILILKFTPDLIDTSDKCSPSISYILFLNDSQGTSIKGL